MAEKERGRGKEMEEGRRKGNKRRERGGRKRRGKGEGANEGGLGGKWGFEKLAAPYRPPSRPLASVLRE